MEQEEKTTEQQLEFERQVSLLNKLGQLEEFRIWKELVVKDNLAALKRELANPLELSEANLKAKLLQLNSLEYFFDEIFNQVKDTK
jgi:hypothetical protein